MKNDKLRLDDYQRATSKTDQNAIAGQKGLQLPTLGLFGETGSLLSELKKKQRDKKSYFAYDETIVEEFGDVLWYLSNIAGRLGVRLSDLANANPTRIRVSTFGDLQRSAKHSATRNAFAIGLLDLAAVVGKVVKDLNKRTENRNEVVAGLADFLKCLAHSAVEANVSLSKAAANNILKVTSRWPSVHTLTPLFDDKALPEERLPRKVQITLTEKTLNNRTFVMQQCNGINIGDRLTDNKSEPDDYRFHDVFHLAYAAILGWSPVTRALFKLKRKSDAQKDENEDGARAVLLEECISTWVFNRGGRFKFYENINSVDYDLLKSINHFVKGYEVEKCPLWMWEHAILEGYRIFRFMKKHRAGVVTLDLSKRTINVRRVS